MSLRYYTEVYPARIVFVSFLEDPKVKGRMVTALESMGIVPLQFRLDARRPDLTKVRPPCSFLGKTKKKPTGILPARAQVDTLLGLLSSETEFFCQHTEKLGEMIKAQAPFEAVVGFMVPIAI